MRTHQKLKTRLAFYDAMLDLCMSGQSFDSISLRQLTREVGVAPTAFYRHFKTLDELGKYLAEEKLSQTLLTLRDELKLAHKHSLELKVETNIQLFFELVERHARSWHFLVSERYGGCETLRKAIESQISLFIQMIAEDLSIQPSFQHLSAYDRRLIAEAALNLSLSWVLEWLQVSESKHLVNDSSERQILQKKQRIIFNRSTQVRLLLYGTLNWQSKAEIRLDN